MSSDRAGMSLLEEMTRSIMGNGQVGFFASRYGLTEQFVRDNFTDHDSTC